MANYMPGLRPIAHLLDDPQISEIMINGPRVLYIERLGKFEELAPVFSNAEALTLLVEHLLHGTGRTVSVRSPFVDFRMTDGSRVNVVVPPVAVDGAIVTIRKHTKTVTSMNDLVERGTMSPRMAWFLCAAVKAKLNILFSGATGTGKTTTLGLLSAYIPDTERIITVEDTAELTLRQRHVVRMECRAPGTENSANEVTLEMLLKNSLRMRPHRILVGEIRGSEAVEMLHAMTTGHEGCMGVMHASSPADAISRLEMMVMSRGLQLPLFAVDRQIAGALDLIIQHEILLDGTRRVTRITEVLGTTDDRVELQDLYTYQIDRHGEDGTIAGRFVCSGVQPAFLSKFHRENVALVPDVFAPGAE